MFIEGLEYSKYLQNSIQDNYQFLKDIQALYSSVGIPLSIINGKVERYYPNTTGNNKIFIKVIKL